MGAVIEEKPRVEFRVLTLNLDTPPVQAPFVVWGARAVPFSDWHAAMDWANELAISQRRVREAMARQVPLGRGPRRCPRCHEPLGQHARTCSYIRPRTPS